MVDGEKIGKGASMVSGGLNDLTGLVNDLIGGVTNFFRSLTWMEWAILVIIIVTGAIYWVLKNQYEANNEVYEKKRVRKFKF